MADEQRSDPQQSRMSPPGGMTADYSPKQGGEREFEVGKDESWFANVKRTYDEFQQESLEEMRRQRAQFMESFNRSRAHTQELDNVALQALQNAVLASQQLVQQSIRHTENTVETSEMVGKEALKHNANTDETCNMTGKQAVRHADIAMDRTWNIDEVAYLLSKNEVFTEAVAAAVAKAVQPVMDAAVQRATKQG